MNSAMPLSRSRDARHDPLRQEGTVRIPAIAAALVAMKSKPEAAPGTADATSEHADDGASERRAA